MSVARDGTAGTFGITWRRVEIGGRLYVQEFCSGERDGVLVGPVADEREARDFMVARGRAVKAANLANRAEVAAAMGFVVIILDHAKALSEAEPEPPAPDEA